MVYVVRVIDVIREGYRNLIFCNGFFWGERGRKLGFRINDIF